MKLNIILLALLFNISCSVKEITHNIEQGVQTLTPDNIMLVFEQKIMGTTPISKGPIAVIEYLEQLDGFNRNKNFDFGNGSVRFNAENAELYGKKLFDNKSLFLLNYDVNKPSYSGWILFQAIYWFENEEDKVALYNMIMQTLNQELKLEKVIKRDILGNEYERYKLPNSSQFNLKHGTKNGKFIIDILWSLES